MFRIFVCHRSLAGHLVDNPVAPFNRALWVLDWGVVAWRPDQANEESRLFERQIGHVLAEVSQRTILHSVGLFAEIGTVQLNSHDLSLIKVSLNLLRQSQFINLSTKCMAPWSQFTRKAPRVHLSMRLCA